MLLKLINDGADINIQDNSGWSPLCVAVWNRNIVALIKTS